MSRPIIGWGLGMCLLGAIGAVIFGFEGVHEPALLFGIGGFMVLLGLVLLVTGLSRNVPAPTLSVADVSPPTTWTALGFVLMAVGVVAGAWAAIIGGGVVLVGIGGLVREARAQRRALRGERSR